MLNFKQYSALLSEATLKNSGVDAPRHAKKYIEPFIGQEETHTLKTDHGELPAGAKLSVHGYEVDDSGKHHAIVSAGGKKRYSVPFSKIEKPKAKQAKYNDEHAHAKIWNHMTSVGISQDKAAMLLELQKAKKDKSHPLHFNNAEGAGFVGGRKTEDHKQSYHDELENAVHTVHALATHPHFSRAIREGHIATVTGGGRGELSETWRNHNATQGATSKTDIAIINPNSKKAKGIRVSLKKGVGSQLMSSGPEEMAAVHDHAARQMLAEHPRYSGLSDKQKNKIHAEIMSHVEQASKHAEAARTAKESELDGLVKKAQAHMDTIHEEHPAMNHLLRKEAATGEGKFGKDSPYTASYLVKSSYGGRGASVKPTSEINFQGPKIRVAKPKGMSGGKRRSLNFKLDER
jgi:hypothetical protein